MPAHAANHARLPKILVANGVSICRDFKFIEYLREEKMKFIRGFFR